MKTFQEIKQIESMIRKWDKAYYGDNTSLVSDQVYDQTVREVLDWYSANPDVENVGPTANVGSSLTNSQLRRIKHKTRMLSLANSYSVIEVKEFLDRYGIHEWIAEQKMDGLSLSLCYEHGHLVRAVTRGDGEFGEDVTEAAKEIDNIPKSLKSGFDKLSSIEIRGEVLIPKRKFQEINEQQLEKDLPPFATSRNLAAGTLRQLNTSLVKERGLKFVAYYVINSTDTSIMNFIKSATTTANGTFLSGKLQSDMLCLLSEYLGFEVPQYTIDNDIEKCIDILRDSSEYDTDGVVFKNNHIDEWLEETAKTPKWAFAYKYPTQQVESKLLGVTWQVGRTGKITPVAELEPVVISGTVVSRATLHNPDEIKRKDIRMGDYVIVEKAAEIIPQVVGPIPTKRGIVSHEIIPPTKCPVCGATVTTRDTSLYCMGTNCGVQIIAKLAYFADRVNMDIQGLGTSTVEKFVDAGVLTDIASIYELKNHREQLIQMDKLSVKSVDKLLAAIEESRDRDFGVILGSLGIPRVGRTTGRRLASTFNCWKSILRDGCGTRFSNTSGVGESSASDIVDWFIKTDAISKSKFDQWMLSGDDSLIEEFVTYEFGRLLYVGLGVWEQETHTACNKLAGKVFCMTGSVPISRVDLQNEILSNGGDFTSSVTKRTNYVIVGVNPTAKKLEAAKKNGAAIISYEEYLNMIK